MHVRNEMKKRALVRSQQSAQEVQRAQESTQRCRFFVRFSVKGN